MRPAPALLAVLLALAGATAVVAQDPAPAEPPPATEPDVPPPAESPTPEDAAEASAPGEGQEPEGAPPAPPPDPNRIHFELPVGSGPEGGKVAGSADRLETEGEDETVLEGDVEIRYRDLLFRAQRVVLHRTTKTVEAEGDVVFDQGPRRIGAARVDFDLETETGTFWNASAYVEPDHYFTGAVLSKTGENDYEIRDGIFTSCTGDATPDWSVAMSRGDVEIGEYAHVRHARVRLKRLPLFYWPYLVWPARTERTSGLLIPNIGYSERRGTYLGLAYYQLFGDSADGTLYLDAYAEEYAGLGAEIRYRPSEGTTGKATFYLLRNPDLEAEGALPAREAGTEWRGRYEHTSNDLPFGTRGVLYWEDYSDYEYFRQFERSERNNTRGFLYSSAFLSGTWGAHSLNMLADQRETFLGSGDVVEQRQLPELSYRLRKLKLGDSRLYLSLDSTVNYLQSARDGSYDVGYGRVDLAPELTVPLRVAPWLSVSMSAGGRATWWGESLPETRVDPETGENARFCGDEPVGQEVFFCGDSLDRVVPSASLDLIGPSFSRIFDRGVGRFGKFKHLIEPRWRYSYSGTFDDQELVPRFDEIDGFRAAHVGEFALVNRVLAKPADESGGGAFEILSLELAQGYSFDDDQPLQRSKDGSITSQESGISARLRVNPSRQLNLQSQAVWSTLFDGLSSTSLSIGAELDRVDLDLTWFTNYDPELDEKTSDQARLSTRLEVVPNRLNLAAHVNYNLETSKVQQQRYMLTYTSQCWSFVIEAREQITASFTSRDYRFLLNLKNVGTFLDLNSGESIDR